MRLRDNTDNSQQIQVSIPAMKEKEKRRGLNYPVRSPSQSLFEQFLYFVNVNTVMALQPRRETKGQVYIAVMYKECAQNVMAHIYPEPLLAKII